MDRRRFVIGAAATTLASGPAFAQDAYPSHAITIINAFPPGGINDIVTRPLAAAMEPILKQPVVVETKAGACVVSPKRKLRFRHEQVATARFQHDIATVPGLIIDQPPAVLPGVVRCHENVARTQDKQLAVARGELQSARERDDVL